MSRQHQYLKQSQQRQEFPSGVPPKLSPGTVYLSFEQMNPTTLNLYELKFKSDHFIMAVDL